ncbi:flagellar basal body P-ring protein FlgI [bacterium]|nr:flagellar basal body P-ring protein FlgI [bacterium]
MKRRAYIFVILFLLPLSSFAQSRIKDLARIDGINSMQLIGYGLIVGLDGSGDSPRALFTNQALKNMLDRFGISLESDRVRVRNVAGVMVTAELPPFAKVGQKIDVIVSSMGDARSLSGGTLLLTPLIGVDENIYGIAQGPVSLGGFSVEEAGVSVSQNMNSVGRIPNGLMVERELTNTLEGLEFFRYALFEGDFTTATRIAEAINSAMGDSIARAIDPVSVEVQVAPEFSGGAMAMISMTESITVTTDQRARVIVNERTGTVAIGGNVKLSNVAITHGALSISIVSTPAVSQPGPFSPGRTVQDRVSQINVQQEGTKVTVIPESNSIADVASALNSLGVTPRDIISIFQALKQAGALQAELVII